MSATTKNGQAPKRARGLGRKTLALREHVAFVFDNFDGSMSSRQVFYQLVSRGAVANTDNAYDSVARLLVAMRRDGTIPYERVVDRTRRRHKVPGWDGVRDAMESIASHYRRDPWDEQTTHVHIACEKQALEGVFSEVVDTYGAPLYVTRGFASEAFVYEWSVDIRRACADGHDVAISYFGDCDPSGFMIELDCQRRLGDLIAGCGGNVTWNREGIDHDDLVTYGLVNVPVKHTDSRARSYLEKYGDRAAELDALRPDVLRDRIVRSIVKHIDIEPWNRLHKVADAERESLEMVAGNFTKALDAVRRAS